MLWLDEAIFTVTSNCNGKVRYSHWTNHCLPKYMEGTVKYPNYVKVWHAFEYHGIVKLVVLTKSITVDQERCLELLSDHLQDCFNSYQCEVLQHVGAQPHRFKLVLGWLDFVGVNYVKNW